MWRIDVFYGRQAVLVGISKVQESNKFRNGVPRGTNLI